MTTTQYGAHCYTADAIVPLDEFGDCDWCGGNHTRRYVWGETERRNNGFGEAVSYGWMPIPLTDPVPSALIEKPENFSEDGI